MNNIYLTKSLEIKPLDYDKKKVKMAIAHFGNIDKVGDIIDNKAFDKTISITKKKWHFINHNPDIFLGQFSDLYKEGDYLIAVSELDERNTFAPNLILSYEKGEINYHSIGYRVLKEEQKSDYNLLIEIDLYEGSSLTVPAANPLTPFLGFKSLGNQQHITEELINLNQKYFSKRTNSEEKALIRLKIKQLSQMFFNLKSIVPEETTIQPQVIENHDEKLKQFYKLILNKN